jgi:hypothetical protein
MNLTEYIITMIVSMTISGVFGWFIAYQIHNIIKHIRKDNDHVRTYRSIRINPVGRKVGYFRW